MDQPIKYSDLLQPDDSIEKAIKQLQDLNEEYTKMYNAVKKQAVDVDKELDKVSGATEETRKKTERYVQEVDRLAKAEKELEFAISDTAKQIAELRLQKQEAQNVAKLTAKLNQSEAGSYNALSAQYSLNKIQLNKLSQEYRENTAAGQKLVKETEEIYAKMKLLQESTGKYTLNVGNYKSAWDGLGVSAQQLVRELPSLAVSANTFFLAISNNIPMLVDEINRIKLANKEAAANGEKTVPVWKQVTKAFLSWNTAISVGVTLLTVYGGDIIDWIGKITKGTDALEALQKEMQGVNEAMLTGSKNAQTNIVRLDLLYKATQDTTRSTKERKEAVDELQKLYPKYFQNLSDEEILAGKASTSYLKLRDAILETAMARAAEEKLIENSKKLLDLEQKQTDLVAERLKVQTRIKEQSATVMTSASTGLNVSQAASTANYLALKNLEAQAKATQAEIDALNKANQTLKGKINISSLLGADQQQTTTTTTTTKDTTYRDTKKNLDITKKLYESQTDLIADELVKQREELLNAYNAEYADLMNKFNNDKTLTQESRDNINQIIINKQKKLNQDLQALDAQQQQRDLETQQQTLQLRLDASVAGSEEENALRIQLIENARKQELLANSQLIESQRQDEKLINERYDREILQQDSNFQQERAMALFDQQQALSQSEFDLLKTTEDEKTQFRLKAEKERLLKILQLNSLYGNQLSKEHIATYKNIIKKIDQEIEASSKGNRDIYDMIGLKLDDEQKQAISQSVGFSISQLQSILDAQLQIKEQALQAAQEETDAIKDRLDKEIEARNNGYANNVATVQKELELSKKKEEKALREKQKAQREQQALDTLTQTSSLITASAEIWKSLAGIPIVGHILAVAAIATMWSSFAAAKIKAREATKTEYGEGGMEFLEGGSHQSGNDIDLGHTPDGRQRRAEGGEAFVIINKRNTRKYRKHLPAIIKSLNNGTFEKKYLNAFNADGMQISINASNPITKELERNVRAIKEQGERRYMVNGKGQMIEKYKNLTRVIK